MEETFADYIWHTLGFEPCVGSDYNVYLRLENDEHGNEYYSYIIVYMDNLLCIQQDPEKYLNLVDRYFHLKESPECPTMYLGEDISQFAINNNGNSVTCWDTITDRYIKK